MQDAVNLAWKITMVAHEQASPALLASYSAERSAVGDMVLRNASRMTDLATLSNPAAQTARNVALHLMLGIHLVRDKMAATMSEVEIAYRESPLSAGRHAGARVPPDHYNGPPPGAGSTPLFVLYATDAEKAAALVARFPRLLEPRMRAPPQTGQLLLVRPDAYIGLSADADDWEEVEAYLQGFAA